MCFAAVIPSSLDACSGWWWWHSRLGKRWPDHFLQGEGQPSYPHRRPPVENTGLDTAAGVCKARMCFRTPHETSACYCEMTVQKDTVTTHTNCRQGDRTPLGWIQIPLYSVATWANRGYVIYLYIINEELSFSWEDWTRRAESLNRREAVKASSTSVQRLLTQTACKCALVTIAVTGTLGSCLIDEKILNE